MYYHIQLLCHPKEVPWLSSQNKSSHIRKLFQVVSAHSWQVPLYLRQQTKHLLWEECHFGSHLQRQCTGSYFRSETICGMRCWDCESSWTQVCFKIVWATTRLWFEYNLKFIIECGVKERWSCLFTVRCMNGHGWLKDVGHASSQQVATY